MITEMDYYNIIDTAREDGLEKGRMEGRIEGRAEGLVKGRIEEKSSIAVAFKKRGVAMDIISAATGLPESEIAAL